MKLSRIQISKQIFSRVYNRYAREKDSLLLDILYNFLVSEVGDSYYVSEIMCMEYDIRPEQLFLHKKDMMLLILKDCYQYLRYVNTVSELSKEELSILQDLEQIPFSVRSLQNYFMDPNHQEQVKKILLEYTIYNTQSESFQEEVQELAFNEPTILGDKISKYIGYIEATDLLVNTYNEVYEEFHGDEEETYEDYEDDEETEDYVGLGLLDADEQEELIQEQQKFLEEEQTLWERSIELLDQYYHDKFEADDFIGYFMSLVYACLLKAQKNEIMTVEDEEMLKLLNRDDTTFELAVESFWYSKEYVFDALEIFARDYAETGGDIFSIREAFEDKTSARKYKLLDPFYERQNKNIQFMYVGTPIKDKFDHILKKMKEIYSDTYKEEVYKLLRTDENNAFLEEQGFQKESYDFIKNMMIRYLARKYVEVSCAKSVIDLSLDELLTYQSLMYTTITTKKMTELFDCSYTFFLEAYNLLLEKGEAYERRLIRKLQQNDYLKTVVQIDPDCSLDMVYQKTVSESPFYRYAEMHGVKRAMRHLKDAYLDDRYQGLEMLKELLTSAYYYALKTPDEELSKLVVSWFYQNGDMDNCFKTIMENDELLENLLQTYLKEEADTEYSFSYQEKLNFFPKMKQKLYPKKKLGNG